MTEPAKKPVDHVTNTLQSKLERAHCTCDDSLNVNYYPKIPAAGCYRARQDTSGNLRRICPVADLGINLGNFCVPESSLPIRGYRKSKNKI